MLDLILAILELFVAVLTSRNFLLVVIVGLLLIGALALLFL